MAIALAAIMTGGCDGKLENALEALGGEPRQANTSGETQQNNAPVPSGPHLYCLTNIGHTMVAFSLEDQQVLADTARTMALDPVGPWFANQRGYYLSRVEASGAGANALIAFDPQSLEELGRLNFAGNSNPADLLILPDGEVAYVALKGSTFDNFASNGLAVVDLATMQETAFLDLNDAANAVDGEALTSLLGMLYDPGCTAAAECVYAVANNWRNRVRQGWLLVLEPQGAEAPLVRDQVPLGLNPIETMLLDGEGELWVVNNGGYADYDGEPGTLQVLDTTAFGDGIADNETEAIVDVGGDPTGLYAFDTLHGWVTHYPDGQVSPVYLENNELDTSWSDLPNITGPIRIATQPAEAVFAGMGGYGPASLGLLDSATGHLEAEFPLESGNGPVSCTEYDQPE